MNPSPLLIDAEELTMALEYHGYESEYLLDLQTGEVIFHGDEAVVGMDEDLEMLIENEPKRFRRIDPIQSSVGWQIMADFVETVSAIDCRDDLVLALRGSHPFRRFKDALLNYPDIREQWFAFHQTAMVDLAREWLVDEGVTAELGSNVGN